MNRSRLVILPLFLCVLLLFGCGGGSSVTPPPLQSAAVSFTVTDTPPVGVTLLSFEVKLTGAELNPGSVDLLGGKGPISIEVKNLETESAFLNTAHVAPGTYTSLNLTFFNPEVTFKNDTGVMLAGCAAGAVCEIKPGGTLTSMVTFPGSGITIVANTPTGIQVDVNPNTILSAAMGVDFSLAGAVSAQQLTTKPAGHLEDVDELRGTVQNLDKTNKTFTLHMLAGDFPITTDSNTRFEFESCTPTPNVFDCLANLQVVEVDAKLMAGGIFLAKEISFEDDAVDDELEGVVFKIDDATHFEMVVLHELRDIANVSVGNPVVITLDPSCAQSSCFRVQPENMRDMMGMGSNSTLRQNFESALDTSQLLTGQAVELRLAGAVNLGPPVTATANRVRLRMTQFTAKLKPGSIVPPNFSVDTLPSLFTGATPPITEIHVQTSPPMTSFMGPGATSISSLSDGDTVSLRGLLFKNGVNPPELIAKKVRKR